MKRTVLLWLFAAAVLIAASIALLHSHSTKAKAKPAAAADLPPPGIAATVNGEPITMSQVAHLTMQMAGSDIVNQLSGNLLVDQEAKKRNVVVTPADVDANIDHFREELKAETLENSLNQRHMSMSDYRNYIRVQIEIRKLLEGSLKPVRMVHVRDILINVRTPDGGVAPGVRQHTKEEARAIIAKIQAKMKAGMPFEAAAKRYSEDAGNNKKGGDIGVICDIPGTSDNPAAHAFSELPAFLKAVFSLKKGEITPTPIETIYGLHLIQAVSTGDDPLPSEEQSYSDIYERAMDQELAAEAPKYVQSLDKAGKVVVYLNEPYAGPAGVAASVNGQDIAMSQVSDLAMRMNGQTAVSRLIVNTLVDQEATKQNIVVTPAEIDAKIEDLRNQMKPQILENALAQSHVTMAYLRDLKRMEIEVDKLIAKSLTPFKMAHVRHIAIIVRASIAPKLLHTKQYTESEAQAVMARILLEMKAGKTFQELAKEYSEDPTTKEKGGDLGIITGKDPYDVAFLSAALALKKGQVTVKPIKTSYGLELIDAISTGDDHPASEAEFYRAAEKQAAAREIRAETHDYVPGLIARNKVVNYLAG